MARLSHIALVITVNVLVLMCILAEEERYTDKYDDVDYHAALKNKTLRDEYYNCFMEIAPCQSPRQTALTGMFSEAYQTKCKKCTEKQKEMFSTIIDWYKKNEPDKWQLVVAKTVEDMKKKATQ
ncbi:PREDICTED: ejaculatory bulb-specific protein 3-like [Cyphomyrmex costatus]|uniref:Ejaculatory bulb-specific protein 3 n=1 Tax=Cyphomyrmex costatus TaxID=456900 RepID=A0A151ICV0_9HYME|nr:PREDICTED: ejaculatory bulb-specific protein 3-like [Cyphomyrmex costatus]KYM98241.1 Ejaculatory bulb-specific protein 3 [Cyphomyrmex costatus]